MTVVTRFAPSPTGYLHIGGARTALFNWLYARANEGKFLLRIEDTDRARSTDTATEAIFDGLRWLGLDWDGDALSQFDRRVRHAQVAHTLFETGHAYKCYATKEEIETFKASAAGRHEAFQSPWRDVDSKSAPDAPYVIRLKAPREGELTIQDAVQGTVTWQNATFDDMILLRSDGTPTYMLAVVVDDYDMGVTHVIRGDDHLINAGRQTLIYQAMGWATPVFAHIPLIFGEDNKKLSKRHGATGTSEYRAMGYLAEAVRNYLARLGWSHGNDEVFTTRQAVDWFDLEAVNKAPARFDFKKLDYINKHHIETASDDMIMQGLVDYIASQDRDPLTDCKRQKIKENLPILRLQCQKLPDILEKAHFLLHDRPIQANADGKKLFDTVFFDRLHGLTESLASAKIWSKDNLETLFRATAEAHDVGLGKIAQPVKVVLAGTPKAPSVFDMMVALGQKETLARIRDAVVQYSDMYVQPVLSED